MIASCFVVAGCAQGQLEPSASLTANGVTALNASVGDPITYAWQASNADAAASTVQIAPSDDRCGNVDGPWVVSSLAGTTAPLPLLACQSGFVYTLTFTATDDSTDETSSAIVTITVQ